MRSRKSPEMVGQGMHGKHIRRRRGGGGPGRRGAGFAIPALVVGGIATVVLSCGDDGVGPTTPLPPPPPAPVATTVTINPGSASFTALGETARFTAEVRDQNGQTMAGAAVAWASSDASVATVDASGQVTAAGNGTATITATAGSVSGTAEVTVEQQVSAVVVSPAAATLVALGDTVRLVAEATDANGHGVAGLEVSWSSGDAGVAPIDDTGLVTAAGNGTATITATAGSVSGTAEVTVEQQVSAVVVSPAAATLVAFGDTVRLVAEATDANGYRVAGLEVSWSSGDAGVAPIDDTGLVTAAGNGTATITATAGSASGTAEVTVAQEVSAVAVSPAAATLVAFGDTVRLVAEATDANGHNVAGLEVSWSSGDVGVAQIDDTGLVEAVAEGAATVTATAGSVSGTAEVTVEQQVSAVIVTPAADTLIVADTVRFSAAAADANGYAVAGAEFAWSSGDAAVVRVDSTGLAVAVRAGTATVAAVSEGVSGQAVVVVMPDFAALLQQFIDEHDIGAAALGVMEQGEVVYDGAIGFMDAQRQVPVARDVIMRIASVTKPVTAAAVRRLVADGMLALGDRVFDLGQSGGGLLALDPFPTLGDSRLGEITVQHLLEHRGGWDRDAAPDWAFREIQIASAMSVPSPPGRANTLRYVLGQPLQFDPGSQRAYSNIGYMVLGLLIEEVSGQDYMTYVRENILAPLGIAAGDVIRGRTLPANRSEREPWYDSRGLSLARNVFDPGGDRVPWPDGGWHHEAKIGHGGLVASTRAILAFLDAYVVFGDNIGHRRRGGEGPGWWAYHTGSLDGTNTLAFQSGNGVSYVIHFNRRLPWPSPSSYVELFRQVLEDQLADPRAARYTVAEALAGKAESVGDDVLISRGVTVGAGRGSR